MLRTNKIRETGALCPNVGIEKSYAKKLVQLVDEMARETSEKITLGYQQYRDFEFATDGIVDSIASLIDQLKNKYLQIFGDRGQVYATNMAREVDRHSVNSLSAALARMLPREERVASASIAESVGFSPSPTLMRPSEQIADAISSSVYQNVSLINSLPEQYYERVTGTVMRAIGSNSSVSQLTDQIAEYGAMGKRRAALIAQDQTRKLYSNLNVERFKALGVTKFKWMHTGAGKEPREFHMQSAPGGLNGGIFDLNDPPVIDERTGQTGYPAQLPFCHCVMSAIIDEKY